MLSPRVLAGGRWIVMALALLSFALQSQITQTHIHLLPSELQALSQNVSGKIALKSVPHDHDGIPGHDDPAHCPFCQAVTASGNFLVPLAPIVFLSLKLITFEAPAPRFPFRAAPAAHNWQGRAPPAV